MAYADELKALTVRIGGKDGGSGVLMKPLQSDVLYILTAWHCLEEIEGEDYQFFFADGLYANINVHKRKVYYDKDTDAAIIEIDRFQDTRFVGFAEKPVMTNVVCYHTGFPHCRADENSEREYDTRIIDCILHDTNNLVQYSYAKIPQKHELIGMSGGGVFDGDFHLLGIHKQSAVKDDKEQLGAALYIPCRCFHQLIVKEGLSPIYEFDLSTFRPFKDVIFKFNNQGAERDLEVLLGETASLQIGLMNKSPQDLFEGFQEQRKCTEKVMAYSLSKDDWARFGEFLLATKILRPDKVNDYDVKQIGMYFQYVYSKKDFDMLEVKKSLDMKMMGKYMGAECVYVIGGVTSKTVTYDVIHGPKVPDLSVANGNEEFDIADGGRAFMNNLTFVNCHLFRDVMEYNGPALKGDDAKAKYQSLLKQYIYG